MENGSEFLKIKRVIPKEGARPNIDAGIDRITSFDNSISQFNGERIFTNYACYSESVPRDFTTDTDKICCHATTYKFSGKYSYGRVDKSKLWVLNSKLSALDPYVRHTDCCDYRLRRGIELSIRYPITLEILQRLRDNDYGSYELKLFRLFLTEKSAGMDDFESSFSFLERIISSGTMSREDLMFMIEKMYPDLYHFVQDVMPCVSCEVEQSYDLGTIHSLMSACYSTGIGGDSEGNVILQKANGGAVKSNAKSLKLLKQLSDYR